MKTRIKALLVTTAGAGAVALLALSAGLGGARAVRAELPDTLATARPDTVLISTAALDGLEQRVSYLEGIVASLTLSSQHIKTYQLCVSGDSGTETCITQPQLEALLANHAYAVEAAQPAPHASAGASPPATEPEVTGSIPAPATPAKAE